MAINLAVAGKDGEMKTFCIVATRELDGDYVFHKQFEKTPTREEILKAIIEEDCGYEDDYGKFRFWEIVPTIEEQLF